MTAITVFTLGEIAGIICDAGETGADGSLRSIGSKILQFPHLSLAVGYEGCAGVEWLQWHFDQLAPASQGAALRALPDISRRLVAGAMVDSPGEFDPEIHGHRLYAIAWREGVPAAAFMVTTDTMGLPSGIRPFTPTPLPFPYSNCPVSAHEGLARPDAPLDAVAWSILEEQRAVPWPDGNVYVRGFGELVTVGAAGLTSKIVGRWPEDDAFLRPDPGLDRNSRAFAARLAAYSDAGAI